MIKALFISFISLGIIAPSNQEPDFKEFFTAFRTAVTEHSVEKLKTLIYPYKDAMEDMQAELINSIANGNELQSGDGAFSLKALDVLIEKHLEEIGPIEKELFDELSKDPIFGKVLQSMGMGRVYIFEHGDVHIILFDTEKDGVQLFFWENLNNLLRE